MVYIEIKNHQHKMTRILVLNSDTDGVFYFRIFPNLLINDPDIHVDVRFLNDWTLQLLNPNFIRSYQIIIFNKSIPFSTTEMEDSFYSMCRSFGVKIIYDIDDNYILEPSHPNYVKWKESGSRNIIENTIRKVDCITTTTSIFADTLRPLNKNVYVIPNAINTVEQQWTPNKLPSDKIRFLWGGGISHLVDLRLLKDDFKQFDTKMVDKAQVVMCGYDLRMRHHDGSMTKHDHNLSNWGQFEYIFTNDWIYIKNKEYREYLQNSSNLDNDPLFGYRSEYSNEFYQRRHTKPIFLYGTMYNEADVTLAPLKNDNLFNKMKSQLKLLESGAHKCPIIMSDYGPYTIDDIEGKNDGLQKGWLIGEGNTGEWYRKMKWYVENPTAIRDHGDACHEYVMSKYSMGVVLKERVALYKEVVTW